MEERTCLQHGSVWPWQPTHCCKAHASQDCPVLCPVNTHSLADVSGGLLCCLSIAPGTCSTACMHGHALAVACEPQAAGTLSWPSWAPMDHCRVDSAGCWNGLRTAQLMPTRLSAWSHRPRQRRLRSAIGASPCSFTQTSAPTRGPMMRFRPSARPPSSCRSVLEI